MHAPSQRKRGETKEGKGRTTQENIKQNTKLKDIKAKKSANIYSTKKKISEVDKQTKKTVAFVRLAVAPFISSQFEAAFCNVLSGEICAYILEKQRKKISENCNHMRFFLQNPSKTVLIGGKIINSGPFFCIDPLISYIVLIVSSGLRRQLLSRLSAGPISYGDLSLDIFAERKRQVVRVLLSRCFCQEILIEWKLTCLRKQLDKFLHTQLHFHMFFSFMHVSTVRILCIISVLTNMNDILRYLLLETIIRYLEMNHHAFNILFADEYLYHKASFFLWKIKLVLNTPPGFCRFF